jgi:hypothetical protein
MIEHYTISKKQRIIFYDRLDHNGKLKRLKELEAQGIEFVTCYPYPGIFSKENANEDISRVYHVGEATVVVNNPRIKGHSHLVEIVAETDAIMHDAKERLEEATSTSIIRIKLRKVA